MRAFLARRWFLVLLTVGVGLAAVRPSWLRPATDPVPPRVVVALALFLMAWVLESSSLVRAMRHPWPALWAVLISYGALPPLAWLAGPLLSVADFRVGLFVVASVPCTLASAVLWTRLAGGNEATALVVILVTNCTSWLFTTVWLTLGTEAVVAIDAPAMMRELVLVLILPIVLGQLTRAVGPLARFATRRRAALGVVSQLLVLVIILKASADVSERLAEHSAGLAVAPLLTMTVLCLAVHLAGLYGGLWSSRLLRFDRPERVAIAFAGSQKTLPVALLLFESHFKEAYPLAVVPLLVYHVGQLVVDTFVADRLAPAKPPP